MRFWRVAPYGEQLVGGSWDLVGKGDPTAYRCSPKTPDTPPNTIFVGWPKIAGTGGIIDSVLAAAAAPNGNSAKRLTVEEWDLENEVNLGSYLVYGRLIVDNTRSNYDVLSNVRQLMANHGYTSSRVTYSATADRCNNTCPGYTCTSVYGDSARIFNVDQLVAGIGGGLIGPVTGFTAPCGIVCGGGFSSPATLPIAHSTATIIDIHDNPCLTVGSQGPCDMSQVPAVVGEATTDFNAIAAFQASFKPPSGWRYLQYGYDPNMTNALIMLGETQGHTIPRNDRITTDWCLDDAGIRWDPLVTDNVVTGFNSSSLQGRTLYNGQPGWVVFRPWEYLEYTGPNPVTCNPIYVNPPYKSSN